VSVLSTIFPHDGERLRKCRIGTVIVENSSGNQPTSKVVTLNAEVHREEFGLGIGGKTLAPLDLAQQRRIDFYGSRSDPEDFSPFFTQLPEP
jgi:hypothetical protein